MLNVKIGASADEDRGESVANRRGIFLRLRVGGGEVL